MKVIADHPRAFISSPLASEIRDAGYEAEQIRKLHDKQLAIIKSQNWFNLYVPKSFGGLGLPMTEILRLEEGLSWADGSSAWVVTLCSGAAWFVGFLEPGLAHELFASGEICFAGSGSVAGISNYTDAGYEINGYWRFATGATLASLFTVNCLVKENGTQIYSDDGSPLVKSFVLKKDEVKIHYTWNSMGMIATGSHSFEVTNMTIPLNRAFLIDPSKAWIGDPVFQFPFLQLAETTLAVNLSGMTCRFVDLCEEVIPKKEHKIIKKILDFRTSLDQSRYQFYEQADSVWHTLASRAALSSFMLEQLSLASHNLANRCRQIINELYPFCGLEAADTRTEINRVWRNFHTAGQHSLFRLGRLKTH